MNESPLLRLAMWSGPRNISTAMMRAWENRPDCVVSDEPFYAAWLSATGEPHPMREEVIADGEVDAHVVAKAMSEGAPPIHFNNGRPVRIWYQKHMCQHWMDEVALGWLQPLSHVFLIRDPRKVVRSYIKARSTDEITPDDVGMPQQARLFDLITRLQGKRPPVIDTEAFLNNPRRQLQALCDHLGIRDHIESMLSWPSGPRPSDGIWARHWYERVWASAGFESGDATADSMAQQAEIFSPKAEAVIDACQHYYESLKAHVLI